MQLYTHSRMLSICKLKLCLDFHAGLTMHWELANHASVHHLLVAVPGDQICIQKISKDIGLVTHHS